MRLGDQILVWYDFSKSMYVTFVSNHIGEHRVVSVDCVLKIIITVISTNEITILANLWISRHFHWEVRQYQITGISHCLAISVQD